MKEYIERATVISIIKTAGFWEAEEDREVAITCVEQTTAAGVAEVKHAEWKYYHKQNKAVCTNCSFERDLDTDFGRAVACPNCGALMKEDEEDEHEVD